MVAYRTLGYVDPPVLYFAYIAKALLYLRSLGSILLLVIISELKLGFSVTPRHCDRPPSLLSLTDHNLNQFSRYDLYLYKHILCMNWRHTGTCTIYIYLYMSVPVIRDQPQPPNTAGSEEAN
jgi:hypothetical protein